MNYGAPSDPPPGTLMLLAPTAASVPDDFRDVEVDADQHAHYLAELQRLRGSVYLEDGAIGPAQLAEDGRHIQDADVHSWHVIAVQPDGSVTACARYRPHPRTVSPEDLGVWQSALAQDEQWQPSLRAAVEHDIELARRSNRSFVEVGGWAVSRLRRGTTHAFDTAVSTYALASGLGGCIGITTATVRHCSARILRKLGGQSLQVAGVALPSYFDPKYGCEMEILRFDSNAPNRRYGAHIDRLAARFLGVPVIAARPAPSMLAPSRQPAEASTGLFGDLLPSFLPQELCAAL